MKMTVTEILNKLEADAVEKAVSKIKKEFAEKREVRAAGISEMLKVLTPMFGFQATARTIFSARMATMQARIDVSKRADKSLVNRLLKGSASEIFGELKTLANEALTDKEIEKSLDERLTDASRAIIGLNGTLGDLFEVQPELFV